MKKRFLSLTLVLAILATLAFIPGCSNAEPDKTVETIETGAWDNTKLPDPGEDGVLDILMIGNSWNSYHVEELYAIAAAAGVDMRVCNIYYSGCTIDEHYTWWVKDESHYEYYETYADGKNLRGSEVSLKWCLNQRDWDAISLSLGGGDLRRLNAEQMIKKDAPCAKELFAHLAKTFPNAVLYMHQVWSYETGYMKSYSTGDFRIDTVEDQKAYTDKVRQIVNVICQENQVGRINLGDAWELYRATCNEQGIAHNLCARLGSNNHQGDGGHDGDIGGGQYLNACVWFEILTGLDCRDTTYIPTYTHDGVEYPMTEEMAKMLQDAAHTAVTELLPAYSD